MNRDGEKYPKLIVLPPVSFYRATHSILPFSISPLLFLPYSREISSFEGKHRETAMETLRNPSHPMHELELEEYHKPYYCDGCKETGFGPRYRCEECNFDLHKACMVAHDAPNSHEFFPGSTFEFLRNPPESCHEECRIKCDACTRTINGFMFHYDKPELHLHPCCLNLKKSY